MPPYGTNELGNRYVVPGGTNDEPGSYSYQNRDGTWYYKNDDGGRYYRDGDYGRYQDPTGRIHEYTYHDGNRESLTKSKIAYDFYRDNSDNV
eukprot:gene964-194_t